MRVKLADQSKIEKLWQKIEAITLLDDELMRRLILLVYRENRNLPDALCDSITDEAGSVMADI